MPAAYTYCGLLDDFAANHGQRSIRSVSDLNRYLIEAVLFSDRLLVNDGHILLNEAVRRAIMKPKTSPLRNLVETGYVRVLSRTREGLGAIAGEMSYRGIDSAKRFMATADFEAYQAELEAWGAKLLSPAFDWQRAWSTEYTSSDVFDGIARDALHESIETEGTLSKELELFEGELASYANRTAWEQTADRLRTEGRLSAPGYRSLMFTANEAYQYHWGCILCSDEDPVRVQTQLPRYLRSLERSVEAAPGLDPEPIRFELSVDFAGKAVGERWKHLADMGQWGHPVNQQKEIFKGVLLSYYSGTGASRGDVESAGRKYGTALSKHFGHPKRIAAGMALAFVAAPVALGAGAALALGIGVAGVVADALHADRPFQKLAMPRRKKWIKEIRAAEVDSVASFELDCARAQAYRDKARPWTGTPAPRASKSARPRRDAS